MIVDMYLTFQKNPIYFNLQKIKLLQYYSYTKAKNTSNKQTTPPLPKKLEKKKTQTNKQITNPNKKNLSLVNFQNASLRRPLQVWYSSRPNNTSGTE